MVSPVLRILLLRIEDNIDIDKMQRFFSKKMRFEMSSKNVDHVILASWC